MNNRTRTSQRRRQGIIGPYHRQVELGDSSGKMQSCKRTREDVDKLNEKPERTKESFMWRKKAKGKTG